MNSRLSAFLLITFLLFSCGEDCKFNSIRTEELPEGTVGQKYDAQLTYDISCSYTSKSFELVADNGNLPPGIELTKPGYLTGTPTDTGTYNFRIKARMCFSSNGFEYSDCHDLEKGLTIRINP